MKKLKLTLIFIACTFSLVAQETRKVLFLGNSYTYANDLPQIISALASSTGDTFIYDGNLIGGYTLLDHFASTLSKDKILSNDWDYIVLQEQSQRPAFPVPLAFLNGFTSLNGYIRQNKPCAQITSFMTWGYENGDTQNCASNPNVCTYDGMQTLITDRYMEFSDVAESEVTPVGVVWKYIKENHPNINLYQSDGSHPSLAGSYLAACCFYTSIFRKNPALISNNYGLDANTAQIIKNATKSIVFDQMMDWFIGKYIPNSNFNYEIGTGTNEIIINDIMPTYRNSVIWDFGDGATSTALLPSHNYAADGTYTIKLTSNKCYLGQNLTSIFERTVNFCAHTNTIIPSYLILCPDETGTISTQPADSYQWCDYFGNPIPGATNQSLEVFTGNTRSVLTTTNGCTERSAPITIDGWAGIGDDPCSLAIVDFENQNEIKIFPSPAQNILNIQIKENIKDISVYNILGEKVMAHQISKNIIDVSNLKYGVYFLKLVDEFGRKYTAKFVKE